MKITREIIINGESQRVDYELTGIELERCFNEYQSTKNQNKVVHQLKDLEYEDLENIPEDIIADLASQFREKMDNLMDDVVLEVIRKNEEILEPYKEKWKVFSCEVTQTKTHTYTVRAKNSTDAENILNNWFDHHESQVEYDFEDELADTDFGWMEEEEDFDPDNADIIVEG